VAFRNVIFLVSTIAGGLPDTPLGLLFGLQKSNIEGLRLLTWFPMIFLPWFYSRRPLSHLL
jgi:hypothetical protein